MSFERDMRAVDDVSGLIEGNGRYHELPSMRGLSGSVS